MLITVSETTPINELASARKTINEMYKTRRDSVIKEIVFFLKMHPDEAYTAREISNTYGLSINTVVALLNLNSYIDTRDRWTTHTFYALNEDGTPNLDNKIERKSKVYEYFYREPRRRR